jgi:hypothetical protein
VRKLMEVTLEKLGYDALDAALQRFLHTPDLAEQAE